MLDSVVSEFRRARGDALEVDLENPKETVRLNADRTLIREAVTNLLDNSVRHGGASLSSIKVALANGGQSATISVQDDGIGIEPENLALAVERFSQVSASSGSGLGLPIVAAVAESHGGELKLQSLDRGLRVSLALPTIA